MLVFKIIMAGVTLAALVSVFRSMRQLSAALEELRAAHEQLIARQTAQQSEA
jgi:hypothetical protein